MTCSSFLLCTLFFLEVCLFHVAPPEPEFSSLTLPFFIFLQDFMKIFSNLLLSWYFQYFSFSCLTFLFHSLCLLCLSFLNITSSFPHFPLQFFSPSFILMSIFPVESFHPCSKTRRHLTAGCRHSRGSCQVQGQLTMQWDLCLPSWASLLSREAVYSLPSSLLGDRPGLPPASNCHTWCLRS